jgi:hypothetical protein
LDTVVPNHPHQEEIRTMATNRTVSRRAVSTKTKGKADADIVQEAYGEALRAQVKVLIDNYITDAPEPDKKFVAGLKIIREARKQALKLVAE